MNPKSGDQGVGHMMSNGMMSGGMMWGMGAMGVVGTVVIVLLFAALVKYVFFR